MYEYQMNVHEHTWYKHKYYLKFLGIRRERFICKHFLTYMYIIIQSPVRPPITVKKTVGQGKHTHDS